LPDTIQIYDSAENARLHAENDALNASLEALRADLEALAAEKKKVRVDHEKGDDRYIIIKPKLNPNWKAMIDISS